MVQRAVRARRPDIVVTATAFSAREDGNFVLDEADAPIVQALQVGSPRAAWMESARGLAPADLAMQVALPEFDGRIVGRPIAFKEERSTDPALGFASRILTPDPEGIAAVADLAASWVRLATSAARRAEARARPLRLSRRAAAGPASPSGSTRPRACAASWMNSAKPATRHRATSTAPP